MKSAFWQLCISCISGSRICSRGGTGKSDIFQWFEVVLLLVDPAFGEEWARKFSVIFPLEQKVCSYQPGSKTHFTGLESLAFSTLKHDFSYF